LRGKLNKNIQIKIRLIRLKRAGVIFIFTLLLLNSSFGLAQNEEPQYEELFGIAVLIMQENPISEELMDIIETQLAKIGIGLDYGPDDSWGGIRPASYIAQRVWSYPLIDMDYIPPYNEGGYDIVMIGWMQGLNWDPFPFFHSCCVSPFGDNYYNYINPEFDTVLESYYISGSNQSDMIGYSQILQSYLYNDLPAIVLYYVNSLFGFKEGLTGIDNILLSFDEFRPEKWDDPADHIIKIATPVPLDEWSVFTDDTFDLHPWMQAVYGSLFQRNQITHEFDSSIATDVVFSSDSKNITIQLDPNAKFSDGSPVLAEDVVYTYQLFMTPEVGARRYSFTNTWLADNSSISAIDTHTLQVNMTESNLFALDFLSAGIIDKSEIQPLISTYGYSIFDEEPLTGNVNDSLVKSCGPFMVEDFNSGSGYTKLIPNPFWNNATASGGIQPLLEGLHYKYYSSKGVALSDLAAGHMDITDGDFRPNLEDFVGTGFEVIQVNDMGANELAINFKHPVIGSGELTPLGTEEAARYTRKAISHVIPRDSIIDEFLDGVGSPGIIPMLPSAVGFNQSLQPYEYNVTLAKEYMEKAGFEYIEITPTPTETNFMILLVMVIGLTTFSLNRRKRK
jgi:ABC-type transport system substrate-binding protein